MKRSCLGLVQVRFRSSLGPDLGPVQVRIQVRFRFVLGPVQVQFRSGLGPVLAGGNTVQGRKYSLVYQNIQIRQNYFLRAEHSNFVIKQTKMTFKSSFDYLVYWSILLTIGFLYFFLNNGFFKMNSVAPQSLQKHETTTCNFIF